MVPLICLLLFAGAASAQSPEKPRVFVLTDISNEPDDEQSLVRFLVYANEFDVEGLVATTSVWLRDKTREDLIRRQIDAYEKVKPNLMRHASGWPEADALRRVTRSGSPLFGMRGVGDGKSSPGSDLLMAAADRADPRPLWVLAWGGPNTLAQALWDVRRKRTPAELEKLIAKLRVYTISDQDDSGAWMRKEFAGLFYIVSPSTVDQRDYPASTWSGISGDRWYKNAPMEDFHLVDNPWLMQNIARDHGPLGELYPRLEYIMEGDTPSFLNLIPNGLDSAEDPRWGGWGGRYQLRQSYGESRPIYTNDRDTVSLKNGQQHTSNQATVWRWREAYQHDFAARMDWCVLPPSQANHPPIAILNGDKSKKALRIEARGGQTVRLSAEGTSDPDGHRLTYRWFAYPEAGTLDAPVQIVTQSPGSATVFLPEVKRAGTAHIILQVTDGGTPGLTAYRRAILTVKP